MSERKKAGAQVIPADQAKVTQWQPPHVHRHGEAAIGESRGLLTAAQLDGLRNAAQQEGFEQGRKEGQAYGHREGLEEGRSAVQERVARLDTLLQALDRPFDELDQQLEAEVVTLVISMVRQLIRREVKLDPGQIVGVVREALGILPIGARNIRVVLHPEDAELVRDAYTIGEHDQKWHIVEDPVIQRGGCRIHTDTSQVDATLDSRLNSLIAPLLAGERLRDGGADSGDGDA
ncbi:MAG: flagellar assembly protein FliH [Gammaproteobacteria bacterium]|nr:flagellar assembly protein FliH [Gammaproteobacteria bacterium]